MIRTGRAVRHLMAMPHSGPARRDHRRRVRRAAPRRARCASAPVRVTLVDRRNHHLFQPLLYQVATAALNPSDIAYPIRAVLRAPGATRACCSPRRRAIDVAAQAASSSTTASSPTTT